MILTLFKNPAQVLWIVFLSVGLSAVYLYLDSDYASWADTPQKSCGCLSALCKVSYSLNLSVPHLEVVTLMAQPVSFCKLMTFLSVGNKHLVRHILR